MGIGLIFSLFYLESRFPRLFFCLHGPAAGTCAETIVEINPFLRIPLRELGYGIILETLKGGSEHWSPTFRYLHCDAFNRDDTMSERGLNTVSFAGHVASSAQFKSLYAEGMGLVEETASYLDGVGRQASKVLPRMASVLYAAESMRLTTRLMQMASWLLLQRAVNNGEMSRDQVLSEKNKVRLDSFNVDKTAPGWNDLPEAFRDLIERSLRLQNRIALLDREIYRPQDVQTFAPDNQNSVQAQLNLLQTAFGNN